MKDYQERARQCLSRWNGARGLARKSDPDTSHAAAKLVNANKLEQLVLDYLRANGSSTTEQVCMGLDMEWKTISPRFRPLVNKGLIRECGKARASTNRLVIKWKAL